MHSWDAKFHREVGCSFSAVVICSHVLRSRSQSRQLLNPKPPAQEAGATQSPRAQHNQRRTRRRTPSPLPAQTIRASLASAATLHHLYQKRYRRACRKGNMLNECCYFTSLSRRVSEKSVSEIGRVHIPTRSLLRNSAACAPLLRVDSERYRALNDLSQTIRHTIIVLIGSEPPWVYRK